MPAPEPTQNEETKDSSLPKGVVLDKDGKPYGSPSSYYELRMKPVD